MDSILSLLLKDVEPAPGCVFELDSKLPWSMELLGGNVWADPGGYFGRTIDPPQL